MVILIGVVGPATFATLAMDADVKESVMNDLNRFVERKEYYRRVGKAWKRGYLLYGLPATGKSSLIAPMANYLNFDIYDLELADMTNSMLRQLLLASELHDRAGVNAVTENRPRGYRQQHRVTLSGFLNVIDGLWSSCGDERIIVFTTNRKEKLDPALLRPGRMDVPINMSYCTPCGFRLLASNYHGISQHERFEEIDDLIGKNSVGNTAFCLAAISGNVDLAEIMVKKNPALSLIYATENMMPLCLAAFHGKHKW
ncbi:putative ATPase, AAA-type, core, P-loop containing nucleoside triphosphate hydrolase [Helianthus anomalus]